MLACNIFYAGDNGGVWSMGLWPHAWTLSEVGPQELSPGGKAIFRYQVSNIGDALELGTFCHENGHMLCGFPDLYDYGYDSMGGAGGFCLMAYGGHGHNPVQICAYLKNAAGWAALTELTANSSLLGTLSSSGAEFNHFYRYARPGVATEYFLLENRQQHGRDGLIPGPGIAVWHVDELGDRDNQSLLTNSSHQNYELTLVQADNLWDFEKGINSGDLNDLYYRGNSAAGYSNRLSDATAPNAWWWDGSPSGLKVQNFSANGTNMVFQINQFAPGIVQDPTDQVVEEGQTATFAVEVDGTEPLSYFWFCNGVLLPGQTENPLVLPNVRVDQAGVYSVIVSNSYGAMPSGSATLTVLRAIPLGYAVDAPELAWTSGGAAAWRGRVSPAHDGDDAAQSGVTGDSQNSWLQTTVVGPGTLGFWWKVSSEEGCDFLRFYLGGALQAQISGEAGWSSNFFTVPAGVQTLRWQYAKDSSQSNGVDAGWVDQVSFVPDGPHAPVILVAPARQSVLGGNDVTFTVQVAGTAPFAYQWLYNGAPLPGATSPALSLTAVVPGQAGVYSVTISNAWGGASASAALNVIVPGSGFVDHFDPDIDWPQWSDFGGLVLATNYGGSVSGSNALWFGGDGSRFATTRAIDTSSGGVLRFFLCISDGDHLFWEGADPEEGVVVECSTNAGAFWSTLAEFAPPANSQWALQQLPIPATAQLPEVLFRWRQLTNSGSCCDNWALDDVEVAPLPAGATITAQPASTNTLMGSPAAFRVIAAGAAPLSYQWLFNGSPLAGATLPSYTIASTLAGQAGAYQVVVCNTFGCATSQVAVLTLGTNYPPVILTQPRPQTVPAGSDALLSVTAQGQAPLTFQWCRNGVALSGATNETLSLTGVRALQMGHYSVIVSNAVGSVVSSNATLLVLVPGSSIFDDFEPDMDRSQWSAFSQVLATNYGGSVSGVNALCFSGDGSRFATTRALNTLAGGFIQFQLRIADGSLSPWEWADWGEGVVLEFSVDNGTSWTELDRCSPQDFAEWKAVELAIPSDAQATNTLFRWRQLADSGGSYDGWALDDVTVAAKGGHWLTISQVDSVTNAVNRPFPLVAFTVSDIETPADSLVVSAQSSDPVLLPVGGLTLGGTGTNRTLAITPPGKGLGSSFITLRVTDTDGMWAESSFLVVIAPPFTNALHLSYGYVQGLRDSALTFPVYAEGFSNISSFQFSMHWSGPRAAFAGLHSAILPGFDGSNLGNENPTNGILTVSWDDPSGTGVTFTNPVVLFTLDFQLRQHRQGTNHFFVDSLPTEVEVLDQDLTPLLLVADHNIPSLGGGEVGGDGGGVVGGGGGGAGGGGGTTDYDSDLWVTGNVFYGTNQLPVPGVVATFNAVQQALPADASFSFIVAEGGDGLLTASCADGVPPSQGVTMTDISLIRRHTLAITNLDTPYKILAADANSSSNITTADIVLLRRLILGLTNTLPGGLWRFVPTNYVFPDPMKPWSHPSGFVWPDIYEDQFDQDLFAIKLGDVNNSWTNSSSASLAPQKAGAAAKTAGLAGNLPRVVFQTTNQTVLPGSTVWVPVAVAGFTNVTSLQGTLRWDPNVLKYSSIGSFGLSGLDLANCNTLLTNNGQLSFGWDDPAGGKVTKPDGTVLFMLRFTVVGGSGTVSPIEFVDTITPKEVAMSWQPVTFGAQSGTVAVSSQSVRFTALPLRLSNGLLQLDASVPSVQMATIQTSTNLTQWTDLASWTNYTGAIRFTAPATSSGSRFYRLRVTP